MKDRWFLRGLGFLASTWYMVMTCGCYDPGSDGPIHNAVTSRELRAVVAEVERGGDIDAPGRYGRTPLYYAALYGESNIVEYLLRKGASPTRGASWKGNNTPLHVASDKGHVAIVELLVRHGVDVDVRNNARQTPLHLAAWYGQPDVARFLISQGADVNAEDNNKNTPLVYSGRVSLGVEYTRHDLEIAKLLVAAGARVNHANRFGSTSLHCALALHNVDLVRYLLSQGANPNLQAGEESALEFAKRLGNRELEDVLRENMTGR